MWVESSAPSNIALIKYMGKLDSQANRPTNSSFSFTLEKLRTYVRIQPNPNLKTDQWSMYVRSDLRPLVLSEKGLQKYLSHFSFLKKEFKINYFFEIQSANNFPSDCGLASSASSFAALTMALHEWAVQNAVVSKGTYQMKDLASLSQKGSGSSCRSFFSPWALWSEAGCEKIQLPYESLKHQVILCDEKIKTVTSSEAHLRVLSSDLFNGRPKRADEHLKKLIHALKSENWPEAFEICWNEFWDMHLLFHTSKPAFMYMNQITFKVLTELHQMWMIKKDGPLITMDAGSNIHLLYRLDQKAHYFDVIAKFRNVTSIWTDEGVLEKLND